LLSLVTPGAWCRGGGVGMNSALFIVIYQSLFASQADAILRLNAAFIQKYIGLRLPLCQNDADSFYRVVASFLQLVRLECTTPIFLAYLVLFCLLLFPYQLF
jgi:hypothetical protein